MGAFRNLSESNGGQKPAIQSKFHCVIINISIDLGFWKAALRITPYFRRLLDQIALSRLAAHYVTSAASTAAASTGIL
jgi:hypothetical protein